MREVAQSLFDVYALALPRGHGFGCAPPVGAWQSDDGRSCSVVRCDEDDGNFGILVMRRRKGRRLDDNGARARLPNIKRSARPDGGIAEGRRAA